MNLTHLIIDLMGTENAKQIRVFKIPYAAFLTHILETRVLIKILNTRLNIQNWKLKIQYKYAH